VGTGSDGSAGARGVGVAGGLAEGVAVGAGLGRGPAEGVADGAGPGGGVAAPGLGPAAGSPLLCGDPLLSGWTRAPAPGGLCSRAEP
jgi:hypothetical protein